MPEYKVHDAGFGYFGIVDETGMLLIPSSIKDKAFAHKLVAMLNSQPQLLAAAQNALRDSESGHDNGYFGLSTQAEEQLNLAIESAGVE